MSISSKATTATASGRDDLARMSVAGDRPPAIYLGIDPGVNGGLAAILPDGSMACEKMPATDRDCWDWVVTMSKPAGGCKVYAALEQQVPRPTTWFKNGVRQSSILRSTCLLYGSYFLFRGLLAAAGAVWEDCPPQRWQKSMKLPAKAKDDSPADWKNKLKSAAQRLRPELTITLAKADAVLLAEYSKGRHLGIIS